MGAKRRKIQLEPAFMAEGRGEAPMAADKGTECASHIKLSPATRPFDFAQGRLYTGTSKEIWGGAVCIVTDTHLGDRQDRFCIWQARNDIHLYPSG
jgi:hypothetical protein